MGIDYKQMKRDCEKELAELKRLNALVVKKKQEAAAQDYVITHSGETGNYKLIAENLERERESRKAEIKRLEQRLRILETAIIILYER